MSSLLDLVTGVQKVLQAGNEVKNPSTLAAVANCKIVIGLLLQGAIPIANYFGYDLQTMFGFDGVAQQHVINGLSWLLFIGAGVAHTAANKNAALLPGGVKANE